MKEIGSEFWELDYPENKKPPLWEAWPGEKRYYVSGRTALYAILQDILIENKCSKAYLPSYCCHTMIQPFVSLGFSVDFYSVVFEDGQMKSKLDPNQDCDVVLFMNYFGFESSEVDLPEKAIAIEDMTHSLRFNSAETKKIHYRFASLRKWGAVAGAAISAKEFGSFRALAASELRHTKYIEMRNDAYYKKRHYMSIDGGDKESYLRLFEAAESLLEREYIGYTADEESMSAAAQIEQGFDRRRSNAGVLIDGLESIRWICPIFSTLSLEDAPLFVPILAPKGKRDELRNYLNKNKVYCPIHWPLSPYHKINDIERRIYQEEMSLLCDQRYGDKEMFRQLELLQTFGVKYA